MPNQPDRCPLCGGVPSVCFYIHNCKLPEHLWQRLAELVAIRDAAVEWELGFDKTDKEFLEACDALTVLAREELARQEQPACPNCRKQRVAQEPKS